MGRTIRSITQTWLEEEKALTRFSRALRKEDQYIMKDLINLSRLHIAESSYAGNLYPMDAYLISMILEMSKKMQRMEERLNELCKLNGIPEIKNSNIPDLPCLEELLANAEDGQEE